MIKRNPLPHYLLPLFLIFTISACMGAKYKKSEAIDTNRLKKTFTLSQKLDRICQSATNQDLTLKDGPFCQTGHQLPTYFSLTEAEIKKKVEQPNAFTTPLTIQYQKNLKQQKDVFTVQTIRKSAVSFPLALQTMLTRLIAMQKHNSELLKPRLTPLQAPLLNKKEGSISLSFRSLYDFSDTTIAKFDNVINITIKRKEDGILIFFTAHPFPGSSSLIKKAEAKMILIPHEGNLWTFFAGSLEFPGFQIPAFFKYIIQSQGEKIITYILSFIYPDPKEIPQVPIKEHLYPIQKAEYRVQFYTALSDQPLCETIAIATVDSAGDLYLTFDKKTNCLSDLAIPLHEIFPSPALPQYPRPIPQKTSFNPRNYQGYQKVIRAANAVSLGNTSSDEQMPLFFPPRISILHPIIEDPQSYLDYHLKDATTLYDPVIAGGKTSGEMELVVHEINHDVTLNTTGKPYDNIIHYSLYANGFTGIFKPKYFLFDRIEFFWRYKPVMVPKLVIYGDFSQYLKTPGILTKSILDGMRLDVELIKILSIYESNE